MSLTFIMFQAASNQQLLFAQTDGTLDNTFGTGGKVFTPIGSQDAAANAVALQSDGKIVVAGWSYNSGIYDEIIAARYNANGTIDNTFGTAGIVVGNPGNYADGYAVAVQSDGKILLAGLAEIGANNDFVLIRLNTDGSTDNTFGTSGMVTTDFAGGDDRAFAIAIQTDGKIVLAGQAYNGSDLDIALARYNTNGTLDNTFGTSGKITKAIGTGDELAYAVALQTDGKIVVCGSCWNGTSYDLALLRYTTNGTLDNTFGTSGVETLDVGGNDNYGIGLALQTDGKIVTCGYTAVGTGDFAISRFNTNGTLDNTFGTTGTVITDFNTSNDAPYSVIIQLNGKIVVAGTTSVGGSSVDFALARYNTDGTLDNTFGTSGEAITPVGPGNDWTTSMVLQPDGKVVVAGYGYNASSTDVIEVVRYFISPTGINEIQDENDNTIIYPNPAKNSITVTTSLQAKDNILSIYNIQGQLVFTQPLLSNKADINIENLATGVYTIKISNTENTVIKRLVKE